jgi:hypothetical protein
MRFCLSLFCFFSSPAAFRPAAGKIIIRSSNTKTVWRLIFSGMVVDLLMDSSLTLDARAAGKFVVAAAPDRTL